jgi:hypothetical protein
MRLNTSQKLVAICLIWLPLWHGSTLSYGKDKMHYKFFKLFSLKFHWNGHFQYFQEKLINVNHLPIINRSTPLYTHGFTQSKTSFWKMAYQIEPWFYSIILILFLLFKEGQKNENFSPLK